MAFISKTYPMSVSRVWLEQVEIAESGTIEQKIALAGSKSILDSIQLLFAIDSELDIRIRVALSKNPKLTNLASKALSGQDVQVKDIEPIANEEFCRTFMFLSLDSPKRIQGVYRTNHLILGFRNLPESVVMDVLDNGDGLALFILLDCYEECSYIMDTVEGFSVTYTPDVRKYRTMSKKVQLKLIDLFTNLEEMEDRDFLYAGCWKLADQVLRAFAKLDFLNMDNETQIYMAEKFVSFYKAIKSRPNHNEFSYGHLKEVRYVQVGGFWFGKVEKQEEDFSLHIDGALKLLLDVVLSNSKLNITAKTILSSIKPSMQ